MTIENLFRVQCAPCERYLADSGVRKIAVTTRYAALFLSFDSAYDEAIRRGWSAHPLLCPDCAADLALKVRDGEVRPDGNPPKDRGGLPESGQSPGGTPATR